MILPKGVHISEEGEVREQEGEYEHKEEIISSVWIRDDNVRAHFSCTFW